MSKDHLTLEERTAMTDADGYVSRNRPYLARLQRQRRARMVRIDYMPSPAALAVIEAKRATARTGSVEATNSAILDAIISEWAELTGLATGINNQEIADAMSPAFRHRYAWARMTPDAVEAVRPELIQTSCTRAGAYQSGPAHQPTPRRVVCGAQRHRDGQPCQAKSEPGKRRCRFHGGRSTGPITDAGKARALANLRQYRSTPDGQAGTS